MPSSGMVPCDRALSLSAMLTTLLANAIEPTASASRLSPAAKQKSAMIPKNPVPGHLRPL